MKGEQCLVAIVEIRKKKKVGASVKLHSQTKKEKDAPRLSFSLSHFLTHMQETVTSNKDDTFFTRLLP